MQEVLTYPGVVYLWNKISQKFNEKNTTLSANSAPTSSTVNYVDALGNTKNHIIGDQRIVANNARPSGQDIYLLVSITNGVANWINLSNYLNTIKGTILVDLAAMINGMRISGADLSGISVTLSVPAESSTIATKTWQGSILNFGNLAPDKTYRITVESCTGYSLASLTKDVNSLPSGGVVLATFVYESTNEGTAKFLREDGTFETPNYPDVTGFASKVTGAVEGNFASFNANGDLTDSGVGADDFALDEHTHTPSDVGLGNVTNDAQVKITDKGVAGGVATLDANGKVPASQLPSYVDDIIELNAITDTAPATCAKDDLYYNTSTKKIYTATAANTWDSTGVDPEKGKIYTDLSNNKTYRWGGTEMIVISETLAVGTTTGTAADGKVVDDHIKDTTVHVDAQQKSTWNNKQDALTFNSPYNASTNKVATMADIPDVSDFATKKDTGVVEDTIHEYVDFGLPSGTLWAKWNVGASSELEYGNMYMYGYGTKQYDNSDQGYSGQENPLSSNLDTASQAWGSSWHMPTKSQFEELIAHTTFEWIEDYDNSGVYVGKFTSKTDNTKYIIFPANGYYNSGNHDYVNTSAFYWTSTPNYVYDWHSYEMFFNHNSSLRVDTMSKTNGASVRPVCNTTPYMSSKADKVTNATEGNFAGLDSEGNLTDSGKKASDFANSTHTHTKNQIADFPTLGTAAAKDVPSSGNASSSQVVLGNDSRLSDSRNAADVSAWAKAANKPSYNLDEVADGTNRKIPTKVSDLTNDSNFTSNTGTVTGVKVGTDSYSPSSGVVSLPAYPTSLPADGGNAATVNNHSVNADVPADADFTNTWRPLGTGANDACAGNDSRLSDSRDPKSHTHGNIKNTGALQDSDVAVANGDKLVIADSSDSGKVARSGVQFDGSTTNKALTPKGTFETFLQSHQSKSDIGLGNVTNDAQVKRSEMGVASGVATLGSDGKVPSSQLPAFVDDVIEGYLSGTHFYKEAAHTNIVTDATGASADQLSNKVYIDLATSKSYRWTGSAYGVIGSDLALGETSSTAYYGDKGKTAYDHSQSTHARTDATKTEGSSTNGNIKINGTETTVYTHPTTTAVTAGAKKVGKDSQGHVVLGDALTKSDVGLGNVGNFKAVSTEASQGLTDTEKSNARANIGAGTSSVVVGTNSGNAADGATANSHYNNTSNPHNVTKAQVGLGSVVNTGDSATPVENGTTKFTTGGAYTELNKKVDKTAGVTGVSYDTTNKKIQKTINGSTTDVVAAAKIVEDGGAIKNTINKTYAEMVALRNNSQLIPGQWYRITDYVTTTIQDNTQSAGHQFDIIVRADDVNALNENAFAAKHSGDTYFTNASAKLEAWELKYSLDNNTNKFAWADATNGKGVIYWMKDEWNNECWYDFKNIMFKRYKIIDSTIDDLIGLYSIEGATNITADTSTTYYCYTFTMIDTNNNMPHDVSVEQDVYYGDEGYCYKTKSNIFKPYYDANYDLDPIPYLMILPNNVFVTDTDICSIEGTYGEFYGFYDNTFGNGCGSNTFGNECYYNTFGNYFRYNTFGNYFQYNTFGNNNSNNTFGNSCYSNTFGNYCGSNTFGNSCYRNTFGNYFQYNTFGNECYYNTFGNECGGNTFGNNNSNNTFGNSCYSNTFGNSCGSNTFGNECNNIRFQKDYIYYCIIENGNQYINITSTQTTSSSNVIRNFTIAQGCNNTTTRKTISHNSVNDTFKTTYQPQNSQVVSV